MVERVGAAEAADVLARAFVDDPVLTYLVRPREVRLVLGALCLDGIAEGIRADGRLVAASVWLPPGQHSSPLRQLPAWAATKAYPPATTTALASPWIRHPPSSRGSLELEMLTTRRPRRQAAR